MADTTIDRRLEIGESDFFTLRDGTTVQLRIAMPQDRNGLFEFVQQLSPQSRQRRFGVLSMPSPEAVAALCQCADPQSQLTVVATHVENSKPRIIATGSYFSKGEQTAEVALVVADAWQGKGLGTLLVERLALLAVQNRFTRFWALTHIDNLMMREVFRECGFAMQEKTDRGEVEVDLAIMPTEKSMSQMDMRHRVATVASLRPFFRPRAVAIVGASRNPAHIGHRLLEAVVRNGFRGKVYPVNSKATELLGLRTYPSCRELPALVDLAVIAVPPEAVLGVVDDCASHDVRALIVITAGFAEVGPAGLALQQRLLEKVRGYGMRLIGPNCLGLVSADPQVSLNATFAPDLGTLTQPFSTGRVAMSSDSGALSLAALVVADRYALGVSSCVSVGNRADVSSNDLLEYWEEDAATDVILLYLESFGNPRRFARIARRVSRRKPIIVVKAGRTAAGVRAAGSHTAALAARDVAVDALFHQTGVLRAESLEEMFHLAAVLANQPLPPGRRVAILTNAGGPAILCADACEAGGLVVANLSEKTKAELAGFLPATASVGNPVDMIASANPDSFGRCASRLLVDENVDALIVICVAAGVCDGVAAVRAVQQSVSMARQGGCKANPVLACLMPEQAGLSIADSGKERTPCFAYPETAARVLAKAVGYAEWKAQPLGIFPELTDVNLESARTACWQALREQGNGWLSTESTRLVLQAMRLPVAPGGVATSEEAACDIARELGFPVAVKLASRQLVHKTEIGGVRLGLSNEAMVRQAFREIRTRLVMEDKLRAMEGVLVQPMVTHGTEVFVGMTLDPLFGPLIVFGLGGIHVEVLGDVCFRVTPLTDLDASEMVRSIRGYRLFQGYRGHAAADVAALEDVLLRVSRLVEETPEISELDLNPIFALPPGQGCRIADARIAVRRNDNGAFLM